MRLLIENCSGMIVFQKIPPDRETEKAAKLELKRRE
jgi:hypothetical protein